MTRQTTTHTAHEHTQSLRNAVLFEEERKTLGKVDRQTEHILEGNQECFIKIYVVRKNRISSHTVQSERFQRKQTRKSRG